MAQLAMVTGASSGIGFELARLFARAGYDLVVAADEAEVFDAAAEFEDAGVTVEAVEVDLRQPEGVDELYRRATRDDTRAVAAAALNAGIGRAGPFVDGGMQEDLDIVDLNVRSTVRLAKHVLTGMAARDAGKVLFTSSLVATMPGSHQTMYNASKSFIQSFAEGLHDEFRGTGVSVTALMPGPTDTEFFSRAAMLDTPLGGFPFKDDPAKTAKQGFDAMMRGEAKVVASSPMSKLMGFGAHFLPDAVKAFANRLIVQRPSEREEQFSR